MKKVCSRCLKNHFQLDFKQYGIISSRTSTSLLQILEQFKSLAYVFNFRYRFIARPPVLWQKTFSMDNSVRRLLLVKFVLHSLFSDGLRPNSAYADPFWLICSGSICIKKYLFSIQDGITLSRKWISRHKSDLHIKVSLLQRENIEKSKNRSAYGCYFR